MPDRSGSVVIRPESPDDHPAIRQLVAAAFNSAPPEAAQVMGLSSFDPVDPALRGTVVYPMAFDGLD